MADAAPQRPLTELDKVRSAIATGDRNGALRLLRAHVQGDVDLSTVPVIAADALVETARGLDQAEHANPGMVRLSATEEAGGRIIELLTEMPFTSADLADIRHVLDSLETRARQAEEQARLEDLCFSVSGEQAGRRIGSVWLELKYIPDANSGRLYGPYLYGRWREA